jgi:enterochelin esterase family protein
MIQIRARSVTFLPPKDAAYLIGDFTDWDEEPLPITGSLTIEFPQGAYVEYAFMDANKQPMADLSNPQRPKSPWYEYHRSVTLPHNRFRPAPRPQTFHGRVSEHVIHSSVFGSQRVYYVYEPAITPIATVYVQDGEAYYRKLQFHEVAEALLEQQVIRPVRLVMIEPQERTSEYWFNERYEAFLLKEMLPAVEQGYGVTLERGLWGASLGGLVSAWLAWRHPELFSKVASQSGCFTAAPEGADYYHDPEWLTEQFAVTPRRSLRFYVETGQIEWLLAPNRRFAAMLADKGYPHCYQERPSGHNWATWEQGLEPGLKYLFGLDADTLSPSERSPKSAKQEMTSS